MKRERKRDREREREKEREKERQRKKERRRERKGRGGREKEKGQLGKYSSLYINNPCILYIIKNHINKIRETYIENFLIKLTCTK